MPRNLEYKGPKKRGRIASSSGERYYIEEAQIPQYVSDMTPREKMHYQAAREMDRDQYRKERREKVPEAKERMKKYLAEDRAAKKAFSEGHRSKNNDPMD